MKPFTTTIPAHADAAMALIQRLMDDANRQFITDSLAAGSDPDDIDAALEWISGEQETALAGIRARMTAVLGGTR